MAAKKGLLPEEVKQNLTHIRTPETPDNRFKRRGLLMIGFALIIAGIIVWIITANTAESQVPAESQITVETAVETTVP